MRSNGTVVRDLAKGAIAGAVATWLMNQATTWMYAHEGEEAREREEQARGGRTAYESAAERTAELTGVSLSAQQRTRAGTSLHWATGIAAGAAYAVVRKRWPSIAGGKGLPFGTAFFVTIDELANPLLGLTPGPQAFPWQTHARGLGGHLAFGLTTELVLDGLDRLAA